jgi:hypothetical protein
MRLDIYLHGSSTHEDGSRVLQLLENIMINTTAILKAVADERTELKSWEALSAAQATTMAKLASDLAAAIAQNDPVAIAKVQADLDQAATDLSADNAEAAAAIAANTLASPPAP